MSVTLYIGPMFSGKSSMLVSLYRAGDTMAFKYFDDNRYSDKEEIITHNGMHIPATASCGYIIPLIFELEQRVKTILIDEGQFFENLREACIHYSNMNLNVVVAALNGTSEQTPWNNISSLLPICDRIEHLRAPLCMRCCKHEAPFTAVKRGATKTRLVDIGGADKYEPVCRSCLL